MEHEHLAKALETSRASILREEKQRLDRIYARFVGEDDEPPLVGSKASFA